MEDQLEQAFLQHARSRNEFYRKRETKRANKEFDRVHEIKNQMRQLPDRGEAALKRILKADDDPHVRMFAASALLVLDEPFAIKIFEEIMANSKGFSSSDARITLEEWRKGNLREYWG